VNTKRIEITHFFMLYYQPCIFVFNFVLFHFTIFINYICIDIYYLLDAILLVSKMDNDNKNHITIPKDNLTMFIKGVRYFILDNSSFLKLLKHASTISVQKMILDNASFLKLFNHAKTVLIPDVVHQYIFV